MNIPNYVAYHVHTDHSLLDSATKYQQYIEEAVKNEQSAISFTEHGNIYNWIAKKKACEAAGLKYIHGVECYLTEKLFPKERDNYHTILLAKDAIGVEEINSLVSRSETEDHKYYKPRISFDEFLGISDHVIKISACLASPLNRLDINNPHYEKLERHYDYFEIQPHNHPDQIRFNIHLAELSRKHHKPLIAGTDTHSLNQYKAECRSILQSAKHIEFSDEDSFDLTYKSYDELCEMFRIQNALPENIWKEAIENTNRMADSVEEFELDETFKYPHLYGERDSEIYDSNLWSSFQKKIDEDIIPQGEAEQYREQLEEETRVFDKLGMKGFMLSMSEFVRWCKENNIPVGPGRGSVAGSRVAYVTDITDVDPARWGTVFSRFCNEDRREIGDIDIDLAPDDRELLYNYIIGRFGEQYTAYILALGTISSKGTIDEIGRALDLRWVKQHKDGEKSPYTLDAVAGIKRLFEASPDKARTLFPDLFYYYDGLLDTIISQSMHPAGIVVSPVTLHDHYGTFVREGKTILQIDMDCVHEVSLVKYDVLGLKNIQILKDAYELAGIPYPRMHEIDWNDEAVWEDIKRSPVGIFQFESDYSHSMLRQYNPKSIYDMSLVTAAIRPSGSSYRDELMKHVPHKNPSPIIDELLADNNGYLIYQEDTIKFLQQICGLSGSAADNVRRAIGRKDKERLQDALPQILDGYCSKSPKPREDAEAEAKEFLQIIEDSSNYQFGYNHSIAYCMIGYQCAFLRYYHPYEFVTAYLNNAANDDDIRNGSDLAQEYGIRISAPKFGLSKDTYIFDREQNVIAKGVASIKYLNTTVANELYELSKEVDYTYFTDLLLDLMQKTSIDSRQLDLLIKIDFFDRFGNVPTLSKIRGVFDFLKQGSAKTIKKEKLENHPLKELIPAFATDRNAKGAELKSYTIHDMTGLLHAAEEEIKSCQFPDLDLKVRLSNQLDILGYADLTTNQIEDRRKLLITDIVPLKNKQGTKPWAYAVFTRSVGTGKTARLTLRSRIYDRRPIKKLDVIYAHALKKEESGYWYLYDYDLVI